MAQELEVFAQVIGGEIKKVSLGTVGDVKRELNVPNHTATVNGEPAENSTRLSNRDFVSLAPAVKGA